jgi:acetylornithine deacetylase/succinyl-diaminopimelate desuccinylase-like protein
MPPFRLIAATALATIASTTALAAPATDTWHAKARAMLEHSVNVPTVLGRDRVPELAAYLAEQYRAADIPAADIRIMPYDKTAALIVRWRAAGKPKAKPIMVMAHMDVVEAKREDWSSTDPFVFTEKDGYYYGRGTIDIKQGIVATTTAILKLKASGFKPKRDIIVFYTGDEETNGIGAEKGAGEWKALLDAEYGLNADGGGGGFTADGKPVGFSLQSAEKTFAGYTLTTRNRGGHSSKPRPDNAIYQLANALHRIETYRFEPVLNETTRGYFSGREKSEAGPLGNAMRAWLKNPADGKAADVIEADESEVGLTRTRCVATRLFGGHADNALPQLATAMINCRIMPGIDPNAIKAELAKVVADEGVVVSRNDDYVASLASPLRADVVKAFTESVHALHPGAPILPEMSTGASDARPFRVAGIPVYGVDGSWVVVPTDLRAHGRDERLPVKALDDDVDHWVLMLTKLAG